MDLLNKQNLFPRAATCYIRKVNNASARRRQKCGMCKNKPHGWTQATIVEMTKLLK